MNSSQQQLSSVAKNFAEALRRARGDRSQAVFARWLGIKHQQTYQSYEAGRVPSGEVLQQISIKLGVTVDVMLTGGKPTSETVAMFKSGEAPIPWGTELEENTQFWIALSQFMQVMSAAQVQLCLKFIVENPALTDRSKVFWTKVMNDWAIAKIDAEEFAKLPIEEKKRVIAERNAKIELKVKEVAAAGQKKKGA